MKTKKKSGSVPEAGTGSRSGKSKPSEAGSSTPQGEGAEAGAGLLKVSITQGDLYYARFPVIAGDAETQLKELEKAGLGIPVLLKK